MKSRVLNKRLHGWVLQLLDFKFEIVYRPGKENQDADALSRQAWDSKDGDPCRADKDSEGEEQPRTTAKISVGGDVGTAHIEEKDVGTAHTEEKREQRERTEDIVQTV